MTTGITARIARDTGPYLTAYHLLGYADYVQFFVEEVAARDLRLLFLLSSDDKAEMCWGDGGFLYFWADPRDIARGDFTWIFTDYQCGGRD